MEIESSKKIVKSAVDMRNELQNSHYSIDSLIRLFVKTSVTDYFVKDNESNCDTGSIEKGVTLNHNHIRKNNF